MRRLYLLMDGEPNFYLLTVPPTSIRDVNKQLTNCLKIPIALPRLREGYRKRVLQWRQDVHNINTRWENQDDDFTMDWR